MSFCTFCSVCCAVFIFTEPTDAGIIPPQYRKPHLLPNNHAPTEMSTSNGDSEKKQPHQWPSNPVEEWAKEQVMIVPRLMIEVEKSQRPSPLKIYFWSISARFFSCKEISKNIHLSPCKLVVLFIAHLLQILCLYFVLLLL